MLFSASRSLSDDDEELVWRTLADALSRATSSFAMVTDGAGTVRARCGRIALEEDAAIELGRQALQSRESLIMRADGWAARSIPAGDWNAGALVWESEPADAETTTLVELLAEVASAHFARMHVSRERVKAQAAEEAGRLRQALLSSISHDFRSPLSAIIGSATSLQEYGHEFTDAVRSDLLLNIQQEAERLNQFVANLLNMTRLQSGVIKPVAETVTVPEVAKAAVERLERHVARTLPLKMVGFCEVAADPLLLEQTLYNILDNAAKYAEPDAEIEVACSTDEEWCRIQIADHGPGVPVGDLLGMFDRFHFTRTTGQTKGTGLGLSIARGFVEAMGGTIHARNRSDGHSGLTVEVSLPRRR
jgi:two-component system sensor histidine kinase KdpD